MLSNQKICYVTKHICIRQVLLFKIQVNIDRIELYSTRFTLFCSNVKYMKVKHLQMSVLYRLQRQDTIYAVEKTIPNLLHKGGDTVSHSPIVIMRTLRIQVLVLGISTNICTSEIICDEITVRFNREIEFSINDNFTV